VGEEALALAAFCPLPSLLPQRERRRRPHRPPPATTAGAMVARLACSPARACSKERDPCARRPASWERPRAFGEAAVRRRQGCDGCDAAQHATFLRSRPSLPSTAAGRQHPSCIRSIPPSRHRWTSRRSTRARPHHLVLVVPLLGAGKGALSFPRRPP
jgi:hypothetical protein